MLPIQICMQGRTQKHTHGVTKWLVRYSGFHPPSSHYIKQRSLYFNLSNHSLSAKVAQTKLDFEKKKKDKQATMTIFTVRINRTTLKEIIQ